MNTFSITDTGRVRTSNQDCVFCEENAVGSFPNLFLVADGMGGHQAGDMASRICVEEVVRQIQATDRKTPVSVLEQAISVANQKIYQTAIQDKALEGMGTTLVGTMIEGNTAYIVNIGDSRLYQLRDTLRQITVDHSLVEEMVQSGEIQKNEMRTHPNKNIITRALGTDTAVRPDCFEIEVQEGDVLLLCSDGLSNMLEDNQIENIVRENAEDLKQAGESLVRQANDAGGKDNISVILIRL
ncbi:MAG: Stp1/IreP family PP2C-type Ser/Thr phosphatase [Lachnospiraceae bacterium]|nr:Stp1/IreP family PP2C-type Ser/Thr phosphatase [Lachnospiraceae bacterium]